MSRKEVEEEEEILIYMDFNTKLDDNFFANEKEFKIIGLDEERPILQLGNQVFHGEWRDTMGTHIFLEESKTSPVYDPIFSDSPDLHMQYACKTDKVLHMSRIFVNPKNEKNTEHCAIDNEE